MQFQSVLNQQQQLAIAKRVVNTPSRISQQQQQGTNGGTTPSLSSGGSFVNRIRTSSKIPAQPPLSSSSSSTQPAEPLQSMPSSSSVPQQPLKPTSSFGGAITQAHSSAKRMDLNSSTNSSSGTYDGNDRSGQFGKEAVVNERRLAQWQQQPFNLSPATHLNLEPMLSPPKPDLKHRPLLVLDVDETLVHASFTPAKPYHVKITIHVDGESGDIFVAYRPHLFTFLDAILPLFEIAIFTASQSCYADQLMDAIDPQGRLGRLRLFREHCTEVNGSRVKDLSLLGRPLHRIALIDNSPVTYLFQPRNAIPILSWFDDPKDTELLKLIPMLRQLSQSATVYEVLDIWNCSLR